MTHSCVAALEKGNHSLRAAPCCEPNDKLSLLVFERFTTLDVQTYNDAVRQVPAIIPHRGSDADSRLCSKRYVVASAYLEY